MSKLSMNCLYIENMHLLSLHHNQEHNMNICLWMDCNSGNLGQRIFNKYYLEPNEIKIDKHCTSSFHLQNYNEDSENLDIVDTLHHLPNNKNYIDCIYQHQYHMLNN